MALYEEQLYRETYNDDGSVKDRLKVSPKTSVKTVYNEDGTSLDSRISDIESELNGVGDLLESI